MALVSCWSYSSFSSKAPVNPLALRAAKPGLTNLLIFSSKKRFYEKYLKEK